MHDIPPIPQTQAGFYIRIVSYLSLAFVVGMVIGFQGRDVSLMGSEVSQAAVQVGRLGRNPSQPTVQAPTPEYLALYYLYDKLSLSGYRTEQEYTLAAYVNGGRMDWDLTTLKPAYKIFKTRTEALAGVSSPAITGEGEGVFFGGATGSGLAKPGQYVGAKYVIRAVDGKGRRLSSGTYYIRWYIRTPASIAMNYKPKLSSDTTAPVSEFVVAPEKQLKGLTNQDYAFLCQANSYGTPQEGVRTWGCGDPWSIIRNTKFSYETPAGQTLVIPFKLYSPILYGFPEYSKVPPVTVSGQIIKQRNGVDSSVSDPSLAAATTVVQPSSRGGSGAFIILSSLGTPKGDYTLKLSTPEGYGTGFGVKIK